MARSIITCGGMKRSRSTDRDSGGSRGPPAAGALAPYPVLQDVRCLVAAVRQIGRITTLAGPYATWLHVGFGDFSISFPFRIHRDLPKRKQGSATFRYSIFQYDDHCHAIGAEIAERAAKLAPSRQDATAVAIAEQHRPDDPAQKPRLARLDIPVRPYSRSGLPDAAVKRRSTPRGSLPEQCWSLHR